MANFMQIDVPHRIYGDGGHFQNSAIATWLYENKLTYELVGRSLYGAADNLPCSKNMSHYNIENIHETDASAFQIQFPDCKVHLFETKEIKC